MKAITDNDSIVIRSARLKLVLMDFMSRSDKASQWSTYAGGAAGLWLNLIVSEFPKDKTIFFLTGVQWQTVYVVAAAYMSVRAVMGLWAHFNRATIERLFEIIYSNSERASEYRALAFIKRLDNDRQYRILVYRDLLWDCYFLPHANILDSSIEQSNDPGLIRLVSAILNINKDLIQTTYLHGLDLVSTKHSEYHGVQTKYSFQFHCAWISGKVENPAEIVGQDSFVRSGRHYYWKTLSELEADEGTRKRNIDLTRWIFDRSNSFFDRPPNILSQ